MMHVIDFIITVLLILLGCVHVYWGFGGKWGSNAVIPVRSSEPGSPLLFIPGKAATMIVAIMLWGAAYALLVQSGLISDFTGFHSRIFYYLCTACAIVFGLRAMGDFRYVGWFKKVRGTQFASKDYILYTPLCTLLSVVFALSALGWFHE